MDAISLLKQQHKEAIELFDHFESTEDVDQKEDIFIRVADIIAAHATEEEKLFYPSVYVGPTQHQLREAVEEHLAAKRVVADLLDMDVNDEQFPAKMKVLKDVFVHHVDEEEKVLFPNVQKLFTREELDAMGEEMEKLFSEIIQTEPRRHIPQETQAAPPLT